jgi:hypothetical protein
MTMAKSVTIVTILAILASPWTSKTHGQSSCGIDWEIEEKNVKVWKTDECINVIFHGTNQTKSVLSIKSVKGDCKCIRLKATSMSVPSGEPLGISAIFYPETPKSKREHKIIVETNKGYSKLKVFLETMESVQLEPRILILPEKDSGHYTFSIRLIQPGLKLLREKLNAFFHETT